MMYDEVVPANLNIPGLQKFWRSASTFLNVILSLNLVFHHWVNETVTFRHCYSSSRMVTVIREFGLSQVFSSSIASSVTI